MKKKLSIVFTLLLVTLIIAVLPTDAEARIYDDTLRLHILANSDSDEDQELKMRLRDEILAKYSEKLKDCISMSEAKEITQSLLQSIENDSESWIKSWGFDYTVKCELSEEWYDTRKYENFSLPAGYYTSLQIIIGGGDGKNWWCVMYPPLCTSLATEKAPRDDTLIDYTKEELYLIKQKGYTLKFKSLELISKLFSKK